jgi:hypothetical protein
MHNLTKMTRNDKSTQRRLQSDRDRKKPMLLNKISKLQRIVLTGSSSVGFHPTRRVTYVHLPLHSSFLTKGQIPNSHLSPPRPGTNWADWSDAMGREMYLRRVLNRLNFEYPPDSAS